MQKIPTVLDRHSSGAVYDEWVIHPAILAGCVPTEKVDGTNVRVTIRNGECVRLEKRRNPSKIQKSDGIVDPWYVDAGHDSDDQHIRGAVSCTDFSLVPDGEWSGEAIGPKIQGNPLNLEEQRVVVFSTGHFLNPSVLLDSQDDPDISEGPFVPLTRGRPPLQFNELLNWVMVQPSAFNPNEQIEGVVWHGVNGGPPIGKIKAKDFSP